jgi:hypothetical protein
LNLGHARYVARPDLADVVAKCGGDAQLHPGLTLTQIGLAEEAVPLQAGEAAELFAVLANGTQFCLRRTLQGTELSSEQVKEALDAAIQESCRLVSPNLLHRARELWSVALLGKRCIRRRCGRLRTIQLLRIPPQQSLSSIANASRFSFSYLYLSASASDPTRAIP